jgi:FKBP-type peptidyl-prolyl cis-trans isomerase FklB
MFICGLLVATNHAFAAEVKELKTDKEKLSYGIGLSVAKNLKKQSTDFDLEILIQGIRSGISGENALISEKELRKLMNNYQASIRQNAVLTKKQTLIENRNKAEKFLSENKSKPGVVTLQSGVQYRVIKEGKGKKPQDSDVVQINYRGSLLDGTEFDDTGDRIVNLKVTALIAGWKEALKLMPVGSKWQIFIPSNLAYGERGVGVDIGPNELLIFEIELHGIK